MENTSGMPDLARPTELLEDDQDRIKRMATPTVQQEVERIDVPSGVRPTQPQEANPSLEEGGDEELMRMLESLPPAEVVSSSEDEELIRMLESLPPADDEELSSVLSALPSPEGVEDSEGGVDIGGFEVSDKGIQYSGIAAVDAILQRFDKGSLTKKKATEDPEVIEMMRLGLEFRFGDRGILRRSAGVLASGIGTNYTADMSDEESYEMWQNWQRSFHGGQTSTLASETVFNAGLNDEEKAFLGSQYLLFDKHPDIFDSEVSYPEMFDGIYDYTKAALYDATTVMSLGVGRAFSIGGAKAASTAVRQAAQATFRAQLKKGVARETAEQMAKASAKKSALSIGAREVAAYSAVDFAANVGGNALLQNILIDTDAQEEFSALQTGVAAIATIAIPGVMGASAGYRAFSRSDVAPEFLKPAVNIAEKFKGVTKEVIDKQMYARINWDMVKGQFSETIEDFSKNRGLYQKWSESLADAKDAFGSGVSMSDSEKVFVRGFMFGPTDGSRNGFVQTMEEAGLVYLQRDADDNITNFIGDAMSWLQEKEVTKYISAFTKEFDDFAIKPFSVGTREITKVSDIKTGKELSEFWRVRQSEVGARLWDSSEIKRRLALGTRRTGPAGEGEPTATDLFNSMLAEVVEKVPEKQIGAYVNSLWKSTLTATLATTGANVRGWGAYTAMNTVSDLVSGALNMGVSTIQKAVGSPDAAKITMQTGQASILGSLRRGVSFLGASDTMESAAGFLELNPKVLKSLSRDMGGDSGVASGKETIELFGLNSDSKLFKGLEKVRDFAQSISGIKLQDEVTKQLNFMTHLEQYTRQFYGKSYNDFMEDPLLGFIEMNSAKFHDTVVKNSVDRTLRETGSLAWVGKEGSTYALEAAKFMERVSRHSAGGYIVPFGKFFNTATAMIGDFSGVNLIRYTAHKAIKGPAGPTGLAAEEMATLTSKVAVGWSIVLLYSEAKRENIDRGLAHNMVRRDDGSIRDVSRDFPENVIHSLAQAVAHYRKDGRVPSDLKAEIGDLILGNTTKAGANTFKLILDTVSGELTPPDLMNEAFESTLKTIAGFARPLDPYNSLIKMVEQDFDEPDRNVSGDKWVDWSSTKKVTRYVDQFFELLGVGPTEATPRASMGIRTSGSSPVEPSLMMGARRAGNQPLSRRLLNSVGKADWTVFRGFSDPDLKSWFNLRMENIFEAHSNILLEDNPNFFELPLLQRETLVNGMIVESRETLRDYLEAVGPSEMKHRDRINKVNKTHLAEAMKSLDLEGDPLDLLKEENGLETLGIVLDLAEGTKGRILD